MELGGNQKAKEFFSSQADYSNSMSVQDKYHSHFAELYRDKLTAEAEGRSWTPTLASKKTNNASTRSLNQSERSQSSTSLSGNYTDNKSRNEEYFAKLGNLNDSRSDNLPPSQGGKFTGFGNPQFDYQPKQSNTDIHELINDPRAAIEKGWSLLSYVGKAAVELGRSVNDSYVKPAAAQISDPHFREQVRDNVNSYVSSFTQSRPNQSYSNTGYSNTGFSSSNHTSTADDEMNDQDFFNHNLGSSNTTYSPTTASIPTAKASRPAMASENSSVRARANSSNRKKTQNDDEWGW
ncbi:unnamed protein product [Rhizopus stolonifer]